MKHEELREVEQWGSTGRFHDKPLVFRKIKDLSDSHLLHIISWIEQRLNLYGEKQLKLMKDEQNYRTVNYIFVEDYK